MARSLNKAIIIGTVGREPEMRFTPGGQPVTVFSVVIPQAVEGVPDGGSQQEEWFNVVARGGLAEMCKQRLSPGQLIYLEGQLQTRCWQYRDGGRCYRTEIAASEVMVLGDGAGNCPEAAAHED